MIIFTLKECLLWLKVRVLVWDKYQEDFIRRIVDGKKSICIVGYIPFKEYINLPPHLPKNSVAVFDVQSVRDSLYNTFDIEYDYYVPKISKVFLLDIYQVLKKYNYTMVLKRKRHIGNLLNLSMKIY